MAHVKPRELISVDKKSGIRFLTILSTLTRGGTERAAMNYALGYHRAGYPSAVLAYGGGGPREAQLKEAGVPVFLGGPDKAGTLRALEEARTWNADILHLNRPGESDPISAGVLRSLIHPRLRVIETNVFAYADWSDDRVLIDLHMHLSRWCLWKWSQSIRGLEPNSPGVIVPYSIDCDAFASMSADDRIAVRRASGIPDDALVFGRVGQGSLAKWSPLLIQAFEAVATQLPTAWLAVCGLPDRLKDMVRLLPASVRSRVVELPMTNSDAQLRQYYGLMDVFVHASEKGESFGMVLCEAMLSGLPVITLNTPLRDNSQIEVVPHRTAGIVVSDLKQMVDGMLAMKENPPAYRSMALQAPQWVRDTYDIPVVTRRLVAIAPMVLASTSSQELARRLSELPGDLTKAPADSYRTLLSSAGVKQKLVESLATSLVNRPISRRAIRFVRSSQSLIKYRRSSGVAERS